jgi:hypothetical protein
MLFELIDLTAVQGPVSGIVNPRRDLVDQQRSIGQLEQLDARHAHIIQARQDAGGDGLSLGYDLG